VFGPWKARERILARLQTGGAALVRELKEPRLEAVRAFVCLLDQVLEGDAGPGVRAGVLQAGFPVLAWYRRGDLERATDWAGWLWAVHSGAAAGEAPPPVWEEADQEYLAVYNLAVAELLAARLHDARARLALRRLMSHLGLSLDHLARMFGVTGEEVRLWERGKKPVPNDRMSELLVADDSLGRLLELFRPERLALVVRRKAELFEREQALDWILRGHIADVADRYQEAFRYQS